MHRVLGVFAKEPVPGQVKTRLGATFGAEAAARLYEAFLRDFLPRLASLPARRVLAYTPAVAREFFQRLVGDTYDLEEQADGDLGTRMSSFFARRFAEGAQQVVLAGSDAPDLPQARIEQAFVELGKHEVVIGPCQDGGYYLVGMSQPILDIFCDIDWSSREVFGQTVRRIQSLRARLAVLEPWYDIDRAEDLEQLETNLTALRHAAQDAALPHTEQLLQRVKQSNRR